MTDEQIELLNKILEQETLYRPLYILFDIICILGVIAVFIYLAYNMQKRSKYRKEWIATLTEEQLKAVKESKKFNV